MKLNNLAGCSSIKEYVDRKVKKLDACGPVFSGIYELMFSEQDNIMYEKSEGYRIIRTTYGECRADIDRRRTTLKALLSELPENSTVGIYMDNSLLWIEMFWTVLGAGFCPLLMNLRLDDRTLEQAIADAGVRAVISDGKQFSVRTLIASEIVPADKAAENMAFGEYFLVMSSGTSSHVKICGYTAEAVYWLVRDSIAIVSQSPEVQKHYEGELKLLTFLPFYHIFGLVAVYTWFAFFARTFVELKDLSPQTLLNTVRRHHVTHIFAVPLFWETVYAQAMRTISDRGEDTVKKFNKGLEISKKLSGFPVLAKAFRKKAMKEVRDGMFGESISFMITGGGHIRKEVLEFFNGIGYMLVNGYGMTEIGISSVELSGDFEKITSGSVGMPMTSMQYKISEDGELLVHGKAMSRFIIEGDRRTETPEWFNTHDLAEEKDGCFYIKGRRDDLIVDASGENLNPNLYEEKLRAEGVRELCITGLKEQGSEAQIPVLVVSVNKFISGEKLEALDEALKEKLRGLNLEQRIKRIVYVTDDLIRGSEFKLNRVRIAADLAAGRMAVADPESSEAEVEDAALLEKLRGMFAAALNRPEEEIPANADFFLDLGGTSLDYFAMVSGMQQEFQMNFPVQEGSSRNTLKEFYEFIRNEQRSH